MDNGLVHFVFGKSGAKLICLNPFCNGQWSRTCQLVNNQCQVMLS